jgi:hypothetical protein
MKTNADAQRMQRGRRENEGNIHHLTLARRTDDRSNISSPSPLTLTLSLGEREQPLIAFLKSASLGAASAIGRPLNKNGKNTKALEILDIQHSTTKAIPMGIKPRMGTAEHRSNSLFGKPKPGTKRCLSAFIRGCNGIVTDKS